MKQEPLEISVKGAMPTSSGCAVFLGDDCKTFVIYVDPSIGNAISMAINEEKHERPMTHDLIANILKGLGARVRQVLINDEKNGTFYARLLLEMNNEIERKIVEIDSRPSDAITLALQLEAPLFVDAEVFDKVEDMTEILERIMKEE